MKSRTADGCKTAAACCLAILVCCGALAPALSAAADKPSVYLYEDTRELVALVENAAALVEAEGAKAFEEFAAAGSRWFPDSSHYLFVYDTAGFCRFHPVNKALAGKNILHLKDLNGKPVIQDIVNIGLQKEPAAAGWLFYLWEEGTQFTPRWKSSYIRKAVAPDGTVFIVGSGLYNIKVEREFVRERVILAADLLRTEGKEKAFARFRDPATPFHFLDIHIFVWDDKGRSLVDPAYPTLSGRDLLPFKDAVDFPVVQEVLKKIAAGDEAWVQYLSPRPGTVIPTRKLLYARKVTVGQETFIVGADFFMATPIWMKL
jgi:signal transduction histidine kinase